MGPSLLVGRREFVTGILEECGRLVLSWSVERRSEDTVTQARYGHLFIFEVD
jgi:hypothetical protein